MDDLPETYLFSTFAPEDEETFGDAEDTSKKEETLVPKSKEYYYQDYDYVRPRQSDFDRKEVKGTKLFEDKNVDQEQVGEDMDEPKLQKDASILVTGFGMRNVDSFQRLVNMSQEERKKWELRKLWRDENIQLSILREKERREKAELAAELGTLTVSTDDQSPRSTSDLLTQTDSSLTDKLHGSKKQLDYLLGIDSAAEEELSVKSEFKIGEAESVDAFKYSTSKSIRESQQYLRSHRIFEFFQFIVAHLLSAKADNPIEFILKLLNQCLLYRSGMSNPPLLYDKKHIHQLFHLMDRMKSGFVEPAQYVTAMQTLAICTFNEQPEYSEEGLVSEETFVEEIYSAELAIFEDLIKRRSSKKKVPKALESYDTISVPSADPPFFIPSSMFKLSKHTLSSSRHSEG